MKNWEDWQYWLLLSLLAQAAVIVFLILYFIYIFIVLSTSLEILNNLLPKIIEHNKEIEKAAEELLPKK